MGFFGSKKKAAVVAAPRATMQADLLSIPAGKGFGWTFADGLRVTTAEGDSLPGWPRVIIEAAGPAGLHRIGLKVDSPEGPRTNRITFWLADAKGVDVVLEVSSTETLPSGELADYRRGYFDVTGGKVITDHGGLVGVNALIDPKVESEGAWTKISGCLTSSNSAVLISLGLLKEGHIQFAGGPGDMLTLGGVALSVEA